MSFKIIAYVNTTQDAMSVADVADTLREANLPGRQVCFVTPNDDFPEGVAVVFEGEATEADLRAQLLADWGG